MKKDKKIKAYLWDGKKQLSGTLQITNCKIVFHFDDFNRSRLQLEIPIELIQSVQLFKVFQISKGGIRIITKNHGEDVFILEEPEKIKVLIAGLMVA